MKPKTSRLPLDHFKEECGVFGIFGHKEAAALTALGLHSLQHRGQEAAGIVSMDGKQFHSYRAAGHVGEIFGDPQTISRLPGLTAIGHNRYSTTGETAQRNIQPLFADFASGGFALAHNGNLTNASALRRSLVEKGCIFQSTTDTEVLIHLIATSREDTVIDKLIDAMTQLVGAYSFVAMNNQSLIGIRDPLGVRPLVLGSLDGCYCLASETCALDIIGADFVRDLEPGEVLVINQKGINSIKPFAPQNTRLCVFEYIYFARPDSIIDGKSVYEARKRIGKELARESHIDADLVVPVPDSGVPSAMGYSEEAGIAYELGIIRNHYIGRTFIEPTDQIRHLGVKLKHNVSRSIIQGRRVILVDDSIVRGTTSLKIVEMMRAAGAREVHMRIASPPTTNSCFYGVDTPEKEELLAANQSVEQMAKTIKADSLAFLSIDGLYRAMGLSGRERINPGYCDACFTGDYPIQLIDHDDPSTSKQLSFLTSLG